jgi:hypothetical protein
VKKKKNYSIEPSLAGSDYFLLETKRAMPQYRPDSRRGLDQRPGRTCGIAGLVVQRPLDSPKLDANWRRNECARSSEDAVDVQQVPRFNSQPRAKCEFGQTAETPGLYKLGSV